MKVAPRLPAGERVVIHVDSPAGRWICALAVFSGFCWLIVLLAHDPHHADWDPASRWTWSLTILTAVGFISRGIFLGRPVTAAHAGMASAMVLAGLAAHMLFFDELGNLLIVGAAIALMWPTTVRPDPRDLPHVWALVDATTGDPLAPFAMQMTKCHHFNAAGTAAIAYRTRLGYAVVSGDPIGDERCFADLVADFAALCHQRGWRIVILGCSERRLSLWTDPAAVGQTLRPVPIGRDVAIDVGTFDLAGRRYRNVRQAVQRTRNSGITTEIVAEQELPAPLRGELVEVLEASHSGSRTERGFSMILDGALLGRYPGIELAVARDNAGRVQGFHRYATAGHGTEITLDVPWRRRGAPNGIDERLSVEMILAARERGGQRVSLAFAAFPELFDEKNRSRVQTLLYTAIHLGDSLIALESLYRYLRKFHAVGARRYVLLTLNQVIPLLFILLSLEFMPRRRQSVGAP
ncbi:phosphatidylglycerol lysyltransferase domain-containing protein [Mycobacterium sp. 21AC1]|uniref:bifunctional lysylphosphatidylglycerol flippase/synthetase MprF n=1 Tax=[Mycobacterium] appelbergii TaxID=2939269 RepID=UPI002938F237|nr:phosphatidylglycerol lysyltransferase domain-containing protein [Mycobacterium sp. 21AC1]MDV3129236.1 phosphatidylglycerol lysyltransferase domain-containing protein [Mycobacterium sp. 21AC1]